MIFNDLLNHFIYYTYSFGFHIYPNGHLRNLRNAGQVDIHHLPGLIQFRI